MTTERFEVQRTIAADPATIFRLLADPQGHVTIDSSGMLLDATGDRVTAVGDTFVVHMDREALNDFPLGKYDVTVKIVTFAQDREIAWTILGQIKPPIGHIYGYSLEPTDEGTLVTSYYDWSTIDPHWKEAGIFPIMSELALRATLGILARTIARAVVSTLPDRGDPAPAHVGRVVILNGAPRSGKSSIVRRMQATEGQQWFNLGVDVYMRATPPHLLPGIGLRPGGERVDLEPHIVSMYAALYDAVVAHTRRGIDVVVDVGHHDCYSKPLHVLPSIARQLSDVTAMLVGVRCPLEVIMQRRDAGEPDRPNTYATSGQDGQVPEAVLRWQRCVHEPGIYDLEVDTSNSTPEQCATAVLDRLSSGEPITAIRRLAAMA